ncbi:carboxymuconolactone decarboxylase family protein [Membranihabitans marinus]|uniref:carboxymuconolactone decarboxylase family protein n=1 Tax=Membranihabitans marinus TaxID=1227546 RepID=UPI001F2D0B96|nr:carboxymuconolactone decarboxylase family protein [Membranihabitans marinus]
MENVTGTTFNVPTKNDVSPVNQEIFESMNKSLGFVPNLYATMAYSDHGLKRYLDYQNAKTSFSNKEKEVINLIVSQVNQCIYCQSAHTVIGKMNGFSEEEILDIRRGKSDNAKYNALVKLAADITQNRGKVSDDLLEDFFAQGYNKGHLIDLIIQVSDKTAMNYTHNLTQIPVDFPIAESI